MPIRSGEVKVRDYRLVNENFILEMGETIDEKTRQDMRHRMAVAHTIDKDLYFVLFEHSGRSGYSYQPVPKDITKGAGKGPVGVVTLTAVLKLMVEAWVEEYYQQERERNAKLKKNKKLN